MILTTIKLSLFIGCICLFSQENYAETAAMNQVKDKLQQLDKKIQNLQNTLGSDHTKQNSLNRELAITEKKIGAGINQLRRTKNEMEIKQHKIAELEHEVNRLTSVLTVQQRLLTQHIRARYMMGESPPLKWLLNQDSLHTSSRLLTYYYYIVKSRQTVIDDVHETKNQLSINQEKLNQELLLQQHLQQQLTQHQHQLGKVKQHNIAVIHSLDQNIRTKQQELVEFRRDKNNLTRLLKTLIQQSVVRNQSPFIYMRKKLPRPVAANGQGMQKINQGVVFFAKEGQPVIAVYPGKVVFSDWLKGYGLLLIIDHGRGFMTLYAHNQSLFKHKGEYVIQNEQIASIGHSGGLKQNGLYFEIRHSGKAIPPLKWLS